MTKMSDHGMAGSAAARAAERLSALPEPPVVLIDESMAGHCSFRTGGPADLYVEAGSPGQLSGILQVLRECGLETFILGRGTNILVGDRGYRGAVVTMTDGLAEISVEGDCIRAGAGVSLAAAASAAAEAGLTGLEFAAGIPGSVGGGIVMNAGAYGGELCQVVESVSLLFPDGGQRRLSCEEMAFGYRTSLLKQVEAVVTEAVFRLQKGDAAAIRARMRELAEQRREKQPLEYPSAGSTFKRPEGYFAGKLIQDAGLRGLRIGDAQVSEKHCGFLINRGQAASADIRALIETVQRCVLEESGVTLEREVIYLGEF